jgi:hypothetical protein
MSWGEDDDEPFDGTLRVGPVTLTQHPRGDGWSAACANCPWTATAGPFGLVGITAQAQYHPCTPGT